MIDHPNPHHKSPKGRIAREETFDDFLNEQGLLADAEELAIKELIAEQLRAAMQHEGVTKTALATRMQTSRRQLDRLFDPAIPSVTLSTLARAANALGLSLRVELVRSGGAKLRAKAKRRAELGVISA